MFDFKLIGTVMLVLAVVSIQYSLNIVIKLLKEIVEILHLMKYKER